MTAWLGKNSLKLLIHLDFIWMEQKKIEEKDWVFLTRIIIEIMRFDVTS